MNKPSVLVLSHDAADYVRLLAKLAAGGTKINAAVNASQARAAWNGQEVVLGRPDFVAEVLADLPGVRWIQSTWAGVEAVLKSHRPAMQLTGIRNVFGPQIAEYVLGYLLARELNILERLKRQQSKEWWDTTSGMLHGKTLGIMGTGSIGACVARMAIPFGLRVLGFNRSGTATEGFERVFGTGELDVFLPEPDYLLVVLPDTPATFQLLDARAFGRMKNHAVLINVGRGNVVDEAALAAALEGGNLAGAVLDVFQQEPLPADSPLWTAPGCLVTAHIAARSRPAAIATIFIDNYQRYQAGEPLKYVVDPERGY